MKPNRRRFLSLMGVTTAAAPLAAKAAAEAESAKLMQVVTSGIGGGYGVGLGLPPAEDGKQSGAYVPYEDRITGVADYIKMFGVPKVIEDSYRLNSKYVGALDPDIVCKRSWSLSVKIMTQRQRNYDLSIENLSKGGVRQRSLNALKNILGFEWPW